MSDQDQIQSVIKTYFECMNESDPNKARQAFHPNARITGYLPDAFYEMTVGDFADFVEAQQPSPKQNGVPEVLDVLSLEIAGNTAVARVRDDYLGMTFLDTLSFLKADGSWSIYNKLFHVES
ncbi:MAG TPA: nuclear transport factor 2 family protein [Porticoccaceae bacterium]|jgi:hypothetical protein|nr:nuclear transport factor 2 family protein [Porticoccaceae bacterium]